MFSNFIKMGAKTATTLAAALACTGLVQAQDAFVINANNNNLETVDLATGQVLTTVPMTGGNIGWVNAMAQHPTTGDLFIMASPAGVGRFLYRVDTGSGAATLIGDSGDQFSGLAFDSNGTLYGVTGNGGFTWSALFTIDINTAVATNVMLLGNGCNGEVIGFNPDDGLMYHGSGRSTNCVPVLESIDLVTLAVTNIPMSGSSFDEMSSFGYLGGGVFAAGNRDGNFYSVDTNGVVTFMSTAAGGTPQRGIALPPNTGIGTQGCTANANSLGSAADIFATGSDVAGAGNSIVISSGPVPNQMGLFFYGPGTADTAFGNGRLCVSGGLQRLPAALTAGNVATATVDNAVFSAGQTTHFQFWYRDTTAGGSLFNTSFRLSVPFQ